MIVDLRQLEPRQVYRFMTSALVPRPIAFISTLAPNGVRNLAPFSYFMGVSSDPPLLAVSIDMRRGALKDTARNVRETGEFVANVVTDEIAEAMNVASGDYPPEVDEFEMAGLTPATSLLVRPPRVAESPLSLECRVARWLEVGRTPNTLVLGEVLVAHVRDDLFLESRGEVDAARLHAVGRLGGAQYCRVADLFEMKRPRVERGGGSQGEPGARS
jgi:flavin reductase (DIM6/NTAB) family NADH-FMN oxidoreductase RutF